MPLTKRTTPVVHALLSAIDRLSKRYPTEHIIGAAMVLAGAMSFGRGRLTRVLLDCFGDGQEMAERVEKKGRKR